MKRDVKRVRYWLLVFVYNLSIITRRMDVERTDTVIAYKVMDDHARTGPRQGARPINGRRVESGTSRRLVGALTYTSCTKGVGMTC